MSEVVLEALIARLSAALPDGIDPERVLEVFSDSLAEELPPDDPNYREIEGIVHPAAFDLRKLETHRDEVAAMLAWLDTTFMDKGGGGGWSFLNACNDRQGRQWTGLHWRMEQLFQLGIGLGMAKWLMPRELWSAFPGGMPYVCVTLPDEQKP